MKKIFLSLTLVAMTAVLAQAQQNPPTVCGTTAAEQISGILPRLDANLATIESGTNVSDRALQYIPVHYHLVAGTDGTGRAKIANALDNLCRLNDAYADLDMRFYFSVHSTPSYGLFDKSINDNNVYLQQTNTFSMISRRHNKAVNLFIVKEPGTSAPQPGVIVNGYYTPGNDWIVIRSTEMNGKLNGPTVPHEVGHFFSLPHTFLGYDHDDFGPEDAGWPKAPLISPEGPATERMDGSNCATAGDKICDTPPDYNVGLRDSDNNCKYEGFGTGGVLAKDPTGVTLDPMEENMMGYFNGCKPFVFTPTQKQLILADRASTKRNFLNNTFVPAATEITTPTDLIVAPVTGSFVQFSNVVLEWKSVPGATYYLVDIDYTSIYGSAQAQEIVVNTNSLTLTNLLNNKKYYWRVRPFNEYVTCAAPRTGIFTTATSSAENIEGLTAMQVSPNPTQEGESAHLMVSTETGFEASLRIFDAAGRQVSAQEGLIFPQGNTRVDLPTTSLPNGIYFVALQNGNGQAMRRLAVVR